ncbi:MAG: radical SAM protein [Deltaproteobacteria bacterium]|nr:radical SAM protein [Deltaproteobacteria bacterium]
MRVLLMMAPTNNPQHSVRSGRNYPIAPAQIAAQLKGHEVRGYDPDMDPDYPASFRRLLAEYNPELVGVSFRICDTTLSYEPISYVPDLHEACRHVKDVVPDTILSIGGSGYCFFPEGLLKRIPEIDLGFYLDGDHSFPAFAANPARPEETAGIYYRTNGDIHYSGPQPQRSMDDSEIPDFDFVPVQPYIAEGFSAIGVESKRGCRLSCTACVYPFLTGTKTLAKSPERIVQEVEELVRRGVPSFFFLDSVFNIPGRHALAVSEVLRDANLPIQWGAFFAASKFDEDACRLTQEAGCRMYYFAQDGISERALKVYRRPISVGTQRRAVELVRKYPGNHIHVSYLLGSNDEGPRDFWEFAKMLVFLARHRVFSVSMSFTRLYPNTEHYQDLVRRGIRPEGEDLIDPAFHIPYPSSLARFIFHPFYRGVHLYFRVMKVIKEMRLPHRVKRAGAEARA